MTMTDEKKDFISSIIENAVIGILVLSGAFLIFSIGLSLMKSVGVF